MDFITEIISYLGDLEEYFEYFVQLAIKFPLLAVFISLPIITVFFYTFFERAIDFITKLKSNTNSKKNTILLVVILFISTFLSILFVNNIVQANTVRPIFLDEEGEIIDLEKNELKPIDLVGQNISLNWKYERENELKTKLNRKNKKFRYAIERADDINFKNSQLYGLSEKNQIEIEVDFNQTLYWRVTPGYATGNPNNPFKKLSLSSLPLNISQYSSIGTRIHREKNIKVCVSRTSDRSFLSYLPKSNSPELSTDPVGFEPELIRIIADNIFSNIVKDEGTIQFLNRDWSKIFDETSLGKCDLAISSISITDEREKKYHLRFSQPYYNTTLALIANTKKFHPSSKNGENLLETLKGKRVGVLSNSTSLKTLEILNNILQKKHPNSYTNSLIQIATFPRVEKALYDLVALNPKLDFVLNDKVYTDSFLFKDNTLDITMVYELKPNLYPSDFPKEYIGEEYGIALNYTESDILEEIDKTIANLKANGQLNNMITEHEETYKRLAREKLEAVQNRES